MAAEARGDPTTVLEAWSWVIAALAAAEAARAMGSDRSAAGGTAMDEFRERSFHGDGLTRALNDPDAWTSEDEGADDDEDPGG